MIFLQGRSEALESLEITHTPPFIKPLILRRRPPVGLFHDGSKKVGVPVWEVLEP